MVILTKLMSGIVITENEEPIKTEITLKRALRGNNKSRKEWKERRNPNRANEKTFLKINKKEFDLKRQERKELRDLEKEIEVKRQKKIQKIKKNREEKKLRDKDKIFKNVNIQVIKDMKKIRKWSKKAKSKLMKMPKEMFEKYLEETRKV